MFKEKCLVVVATDEPCSSELLRSARAGFAQAQHRVGTTHRQRLKWLLEFVGLEPESLGRLSDGAQSQLRFDLAFFTYRSDPFGLPPLDSIAKLASEVRRAIENLLSATRWVLRFPAGSRLTREIAPRAVTRAGRITLNGFESTYSSDDFPTAFLLNAADAVEAEGTRIGKCAQKDCRRLFARHRRARYCSLRCSQKERDSRFRRRRSQEELSRRRHRYYKNRIARERGRATADKVRARPMARKKS